MYNFVDVDEGAASCSLPSEAMKINGKYIENEIEGYRTLYVLGRELTEEEITELQIGMIDGAEYRGRRTVSRTITVGYQLLSDTPEQFRARFNHLNAILRQEEAEIIFADEPDKYFIGTKRNAGDVPEGRLNVTGEFSIYCCDPRKYSTVEKTFQASANEEGILEATIENDGNVAVPVNYEITHNHENGFIGIVSEHGAIQLGKIDEVDAVPAEKSEVLFRCDSASEFLSAFTAGEGIFDKNYDYGRNGTFGSVSLEGRQWLSLDSVGSGSSWHGAIAQKILPEDSSGAVGAKNFTCQFTMWFETGKVPQTGAIEVVIGDSSGKQIMSMHIVKSSTNTNICNAKFQVGSVEKGKAQYEPGYWSYTAKGGVIKMRKSGGTFEFHFAGKKYTYTDSSLKDKEAYSVSISEIQYSNRGKSNLVTHMYFGYLYFQKDNVEYLKDIPNRYPEDSVVYVDGKTTRVYVDGVPSQQDEVKGSKYFKVPPGETKVQFYYSDFADPPPTIEARIREAYL